MTSVAVNATETIYSSVSALNNAIGSISTNAGDIFILADGTYLNNTLNIGKSNITVKAATPGGVFLNGSNAITISGSNVVFSGFQFTSGTITGNVITVTGSNNSITQLNFNGYSAQKMIVLNNTGQYNTISNCNFENKPRGATAGNLIHIDPNISFPGYHKIRYCSFQNMPGLGGDNGNECIRISNGATSTYVSRTVVEFNYFSNTGLGDSEVISVKCQENVLRYNTMNNNQKANFCFRNGNNNIAYGNFFVSSGGIRVKEANNVYCYNNYFENCGDGNVTAPVKYVYVTPTGTNTNLNNINFIHNTFLNGTPIEFDTATNNTWANNIFKNTINNIFLGSTSGKSFFGNIYNGNLGVSISSGMNNTDPQLMNNTQGSIASTSPAIDAASTNYPAILDIANIDDDPNLLLDINGKARPASVILKDVGCVEYNGSGTTTNHPLAVTEVGPTYLGGPTIPDAPTATSPQTICSATVNSLSATGTDLKWYLTLTGGSPLASTDIVYSGTYFVSQTINSIESTRRTVAVTVTSTAPTASSLLLCSGSKVSNLTATGTALKWYAAATEGSPLASTTTLSTTTYYVSQTVSACESSRTAVAVVVYIPATLPVLNADGPGNTYELITSVLAPCQGVAAVEAPDMTRGTHPAFGRHIAEVMDNDLGKYVFEFYSHVAEDNDITGGLDRQRVEIKTYGQSTDNLKGVLGETVTYKWRFKVPTGFQPSTSFTHIHQVKAVDGDDSNPIFTLTPRYGTPNKLQLLYVADSNTSADTRADVDLSLFENTWVEAIETIKIGAGTSGTYAITIKKVIDGTTILSYSSNAIQTIRTPTTDPNTAGTGAVANSFIRPKWGIYRSLDNSGNLRDDSMRFSDISISEIVPPTAVLTANANGTVSVSGIAAVGTTVTVLFPGGTTVSADAGAGGAYGPITSGVLLTSGNVVTTYVSNDNTSPETVVQFTAVPVVSNQSFCSGTIANLTATGTLVKWYAAASGGSELVTTTALTGTTYYATQTVNNLESARKAVLVTIITTAAPTASDQTFVGAKTVANLVATGTALKWYAASTGGSALDPSTALTNGTTYYVSQTLNSCESTRTPVVITIQIATQTITFTLPLKYTNSPDFDPAAVSSNRSPITYSSSNQAVATITNDNKIHIVARGTSDITASSVGAAPITIQLIVQCSCVQN